MDTVEVQRDRRTEHDADDNNRGRFHHNEDMVMPDQPGEDGVEQFGQESLIKEQRMYDYEHEDMSPDRNGGEDDDGNMQGHGG